VNAEGRKEGETQLDNYAMPFALFAISAPWRELPLFFISVV